MGGRCGRCEFVKVRTVDGAVHPDLVEEVWEWLSHADAQGVHLARSNFHSQNQPFTDAYARFATMIASDAR